MGFSLPGLPDAMRSARMRKILQLEFVPALRQIGFAGSMPHFHRQRGDRLDLLNVQFSLQGQHFFINLGRLEVRGDGSRSELKAAKRQLRVVNCPLNQRTRLAIGLLPRRLGGAAAPGFNAWDFTAEGETEAEELMLQLARKLREFLMLYADPWWRAEQLEGGLPQRPVGP